MAAAARWDEPPRAVISTQRRLMPWLLRYGIGTRITTICGELLRQVEYKALWNSKHFVQVDRFFPSTQLCSECGYKNDELSLADREWTCPGCRTQHFRDRNAAKNVRPERLRIVAEGHPETGNACGLRVSLAEACVAG